MNRKVRGRVGENRVMRAAGILVLKWNDRSLEVV